jgi:small subunit ribosomal protein S16
MLAIRMQRTGRKGHAMFRVIVQESRLTPTSGRVVALLGSYDPHSRQITLAKDKTAYYLDHGAQPSDRVARLLQKEGVALPKWVKLEADKRRALRHPEKLRKNQPKGTATSEAPADEPLAETAETTETTEPTEAEKTTQTEGEA